MGNTTPPTRSFDSPSERAVCECNHLTKTYTDGENTVSVLNDISLRINSGERVAIIGSSGSGKSTLLHVLSGLDSATHGDVTLLGQSLANLSPKKLAALRNQHVGFVYQFHHLLPEFSALENVAMPLFIANVNRSEALEKARIMLDSVGLSHRIEHRSTALSGGERQRVAIARALIQSPDIIFADEPTGNLDKRTGEQVLEVLNNLQQQNDTAFIIVTHDLSVAENMDKRYSLSDGHLTSI